MKRRRFIPLAGAAAISGYVAVKGKDPPLIAIGPRADSAVFIARARSYAEDLESKMLAGIEACGLQVKGKRVLLKPNLVEFDSATVVNTDVAVVAAALEVFRGLGASEVVVGEGPGHRRDTYSLADQANYRKVIVGFDQLFVDLNRDDVSAVPGFGGEPRMYFPNSALRADLIVSLAKMKTHHWAGATLSMKNLFGLVPGAVYGWPKNRLHYIGIPQSIVGLNRIFHNTFAIVDGIVAMEGNGPIQGTPKNAEVLVMGNDLTAVDATCCRIMGIDPEKVEYLQLASGTGHVRESRIEQRGETVESVRQQFALLDEFRTLIAFTPPSK